MVSIRCKPWLVRSIPINPLIRCAPGNIGLVWSIIIEQPAELMMALVGDDPPRDRTSELRALGFPNRHLGSIQMTTDTAVGVTKLVVDDKGDVDSRTSAVSTLNASNLS